MVWHDSPYDEHPVADVTRGQNKIWQAVDAITTAGHWDDTVFLLTWDDWGGFDDHVATLNVRAHPRRGSARLRPPRPAAALRRTGQARGRRSLNSHVSIGRTVLDLLGLPPLGIPRLDDAVSLTDLVLATAPTPPPPVFGTSIRQPVPPSPTPDPVPPPPSVARRPLPVATSAPVGPVLLRDGSTLPPPNDHTVT